MITIYRTASVQMRRGQRESVMIEGVARDLREGRFGVGGIDHLRSRVVHVSVLGSLLRGVWSQKSLILSVVSAEHIKRGGPS